MHLLDFTNWATYRKEGERPFPFNPKDIDTKLCTHVNFGFVVLDPTELIIRIHDVWVDCDDNVPCKNNIGEKLCCRNKVGFLREVSISISNRQNHFITQSNNQINYMDKHILLIQISALKKHGIITSVALGGWTDSNDDKYSRMVKTKESRKKFIDSALSFIEAFGYQGLDLDWEYPVCWQVLL